MGVFDKLAFWKKKDDFGSFPGAGQKDNPFGNDFPAPNYGQDSGMGFDDPFSQNHGNMPPYHQGMQQMNPMPPSFPSDSPPGYQPPGGGMQFRPAAQPADQEFVNSKNLEVISSKIDAIRATLDSINSRLAHIEQLAGVEQEERRRKYY